MKTRLFIGLTLCAFLAAAMGSAPPAPGVGGVGSAQKATGEVWFENSGLMAYADFNAHEAYMDRPAKGEFYYEDDDGEGTVRYYLMMVDCVEVEGEDATFSGEIVDTNVDDWMGQGVQIWVTDGGTPGWNGDLITGQFFEYPDCLPYDESPMMIEIDEGNLKVHTYD